MERLELILIIIIGIISTGAIILSVMSFTKKDNTSNLNLTDADGNTVSIKDYLESPDGQVEINKAIGTSINFNKLNNEAILQNTEYTITSNEANKGFAHDDTTHPHVISWWPSIPSIEVKLSPDPK